MFNSRCINNKIKHLHDISLRFIYSDKRFLYEELLQKDTSVSIPYKNIQELQKL